METQELIKKVRKIEIKTRGLSKHIFSGEYHSAFKGRGMAFSEVREYFPGDDIRSIDWNVTARTGHAHIKVFEEERELTLMLVVDISSSEDFGSTIQMKRELLTEFCAVLAFSSLLNNDKVGLILFSDTIEKYIPPKKGKTHVLRIIRELIEFKPNSKKTSIKKGLEYFNSVQKKRSICFLISDFIDNNFEDVLKIIGKRHDTVAVRIFDKRESELPSMGVIDLIDAETNEVITIDTSNKLVREKYQNFWLNSNKKLKDKFNKSNIDSISFATDESYIAPLQNFFKKRESRK